MLISVSKEQPRLLAWRSELFLIASLPAPFSSSPSPLPASIRMALSGSPQLAETDPLSGLAGTPTTSSLQLPPTIPSFLSFSFPTLSSRATSAAWSSGCCFVWVPLQQEDKHTGTHRRAPPPRTTHTQVSPSLTLTSRFYCRDDYRTRHKHQMRMFKKGQSWFTCKAGFLTIFTCKG